MTSVNYFVLGQIFGLLERIELIDRVDFSQFDPDDECDVELITSRYIKPSVVQAVRESQNLIHSSIAYYSSNNKAPIQLMKDSYQELSLPDASSWGIFFDRVGAALFGAEYKLGFDPGRVTEQPDEWRCESLFRRS